jgi:hypothetical protein
MFDELESLREMVGLLELLQHYAVLAEPDRQAWQDRLCEHPQHNPRTLTRLHGELIAGGWIEQNTGHTIAGRSGVPACYRITPAGLRALRELAETEV